SGHRLSPLRLGAVLERAAASARADRLPGLGAGRRGPRPAGRRPRGAGRPGHHRVAGRAGAVRAVTFACPGSLADAAARLEAAIGPRIVLLLLGSLLGVLAFGRFALEWWGRPGDRDAITQAIRAALHAGDRV